jgi:hypothetical protein
VFTLLRVMIGFTGLLALLAGCAGAGRNFSEPAPAVDLQSLQALTAMNPYRHRPLLEDPESPQFTIFPDNSSGFCSRRGAFLNCL